MSESTTTDRLPVSPDRSLPVFAAIAMVAWVLLEFAFRRGLVPHLADVVGSGRGADALVFAFAFPVIAGVVAWLGMRNGVERPDWEYETSLRTVGAGLGGVVVYFVVFVALAAVLGALGIDQSVAPGALGVEGAPTWALVALFVGNGIVVPIAEELAWRGVIQTALTERYGVAMAVVVTALAFAAKHLVVDLAAPPFRVTSLLVASFVLCGLRARWGTTASTVAHLGMNLTATASVLVML